MSGSKGVTDSISITMERALINSDGSIGEWKILTKTQNEHWTHMLAKIGGHLYSVAGVLPGEDR